MFCELCDDCDDLVWFIKGFIIGLKGLKIYLNKEQSLLCCKIPF